jgi:hypothetical protein
MMLLVICDLYIFCVRGHLALKISKRARELWIHKCIREVFGIWREDRVEVRR